MATIVKSEYGIDPIERMVRIGEKDQLKIIATGSRNRRIIATEQLQLGIGEGVIREKEGWIQIIRDKDRISAAVFEIPNFKFGDFRELVDTLEEEEDREMEEILLVKIAKNFPLRFEIVRDEGNCVCLECDEPWKLHRIEVGRIKKKRASRLICPKTRRETFPYALPKVDPMTRLHQSVLLKFQKAAAGLMVATIEILRYPHLLLQ